MLFAEGEESAMYRVQERYMQSICSSQPTEDIFYHLGSLRKVYVVEYLALTKKQWLVNQLKRNLFAKETFILLVDPIHPEGVQGLIVESLGIGFIDQSVFRELQLTMPCPTYELMWRKGQVLDDERIRWFLTEKQVCVTQASEKLLQARSYLDSIKRIYHISMKQETLSLLLKDIVFDLFSAKEIKRQSFQGVAISYFGSNNRTRFHHMLQRPKKSIERYIILKGCTGTGKTKILAALAVVAIALHLSVEIYRCPFYTESLDAIILPELQTAIIDGSAPHMHEPTHPNDSYFVLEEYGIDKETLHSFALELKEANHHYKNSMRHAQFFLQEAKHMHEQAVYALNQSQCSWLDRVVEDWDHLIKNVEK